MLSRLVERQLGRPSVFTARGLNLVNARVNRRAVEQLGLAPGHRALDVGFGGGAALERLADRAAFAAGIDHSGAVVRAARKRFQAEIEAGHIQVEEASVEAIPFEDASFDRALSVHTIYFWPDAEQGLREILRVLKPAGRLVLATDAKAPPRTIAKHGFNAYTAEEQTGLLGRAGFTDVSVERRGAQLFAQGARPA